MAIDSMETITQRPYKNRLSYPNKYLELGSTYFPKDIKELIVLCRKFYYDSPILRNIVHKMSEYPISDLIMTIEENADKSESVKKKYADIMDRYLRVKNFLLEVGINYHVNGNVIISVNQDFKRNFVCGACNATIDGEAFNSFKVKKVNKKIIITGEECPKCKLKNTPLTIVDVPLKKEDSINVIFWNPLELNVEYNQWNGKKIFLYDVPRQTKLRLLTANGTKDRRFILSLPKIYIDAVEQDKAIELDVYHFGTPELAQDKAGLSVPIVVSVLKDFWYYITVRRAQESILSEHIVPFRAVFPQASGTIDPFTMMRMDKWKAAVQDQINKWKKDPNHIMVTPIPLGSQSVGGDAKYLLLTNELRLVEENIINGFGAPLELIKGGVSWSGSAIALRILENHFLSFRRDLELMLNTFILPKVASVLGLPKVTIRFSRLRMGDDQQFKQLMFQLSQSGYFSLETLLEEFGFDSVGEKERVEEEAHWFNKVKMTRGEGEAKVQAEQQKILMAGQVQAQDIGMQEQAFIRFKQERAAKGGTMAPNIKELAAQFLTASSENEAKYILKAIQETYGPETAKQVVEYLEVYSKQYLNPVTDLPKGLELNQKVESPPGGKSRKFQDTEDRVRASKKTNS